MNRQRGLMFGILVAGLGAVALVAWMLGGRGEPEGPSDGLLAARGSAQPSADLPVSEAAAPGSLSVVPAPVGEAGSATAEAAARPVEPQRALRGVARMEDGSALPDDLQVFAARHSPPPVLFSMRDLMSAPETAGNLLGEDRDGDAANLFGDPLAQASLVEPDRDGRFELHVPAAGDVWIGARAEGVCVVEPVQVPADAEEDVELMLAHGGVLEGRVLDADGEPIAGAQVNGATPFDPYGVLDSAARMATLGHVRSDDEGRFRFLQVPAGLGLQVAATSTRPSGEPPETDEGMPLQPARLDVPALSPGERRTLELVLRPAGAVRGVVVRADGTPLADATVRLRRTSMSLKDVSLGDAGGLTDRTRTDDGGRFAFPAVADGRYEAVLTQEGWRLARAKDLTIEQGSVIEGLRLVAEEGLGVSGRVLDEQGQPLEDASVHGFPPPSLLSFSAAFERELRPDTETDATGAFRLAGFDAGKVRLRVSRDGFRAQQLDVSAGDSDLEIRLAPLTSLSGIVVSLVDGEPVPAFTVGLTPAEGLFQPGDMFGAGAEAGFERVVRPRRFADREDGTFTVDDVMPGSYDVAVSAGGFGSLVEKDVSIDDGGRRGLVIMLEPECAVLGQVVEARSGVPVPGAVVRTTKGGGIADMLENMVQPGPSVRADGQGRFRLAGLPAGPARLSVEHPKYRTLGLADVVLAAGETRDLGLLRLPAGAAVHGTVSDVRGPVPDVSIMVSNAIGSTLKRTSTDAQGRYRVEGLPPGTYNVMRMDFQFDIGGDSSPMDIMKDMTYETVTLAEDEERRVDLHVRAEGGVKLVGRVTDAGGAVPGAMLTLMPESEGGRLGFTTTNKDGEYEFAPVPEGRYGLQVMPMDAMDGQPQGQPGSPVFAAIVLGAVAEQRHDVSLPGGVLQGVVVSADDGKAVPGVRLVLERTDEGAHELSWLVAMGGRVGETYADGAGAFRFRHLPGGTYAVVAGGQNLLGMGTSGWAVTRVDDLDVREGSTGFTVEIEVEPAAVVAGTLRDIGGQPVAGAGVWVLDAVGAPRSVFSEVTSREGGSYEVGDLLPGTWSLAFMSGSHALTIVPGVVVREGERTPLDVTLKPGVPLRLALGGRSAASVHVQLSGPGGPLPCRLMSLSDLASLPQASSVLAVGTFAPGNYHVTVTSGGASLLDEGVVLVGSAPKVLELPPP